MKYERQKNLLFYSAIDDELFGIYVTDGMLAVVTSRGAPDGTTVTRAYAEQMMDYPGVVYLGEL